MGRKAKANKNTQLMEEPTAPTSPLEEQTSAAKAPPVNLEVDPLLSSTSHSGKKKSKTSNSAVRRSRRLLPTAGNKQVGQVIDEIHISESDNDDDDDKEDGQAVLPLNKSPKQTSDGINFDEENPENPGVADMKYKTMYINSQKKIEALMEENRELNKALEHAIGKIDVYEKYSNIYSEVMNVFASLSKANENLSAQVKRGGSFLNSDDGERPSKKKRSGQNPM